MTTHELITVRPLTATCVAAALVLAATVGCGGGQSQTDPTSSTSQEAAEAEAEAVSTSPVIETRLQLPPASTECATDDAQHAALVRPPMSPPGSSRPAPDDVEPMSASTLTLPDSVATSLGTVPNAEAFTRAATELGRRDAWPTAAAASLLTDGRPILVDCPIGDNRPSDFVRGCMLRRQCSLLVPGEDGSYEELRTREALVAAVGPIDTPSKALGYVSLIVHDAVVPLSPNERADAEESSELFLWQTYPDAQTSVEVEELDDGWLVRVPWRPLCGCHHHLVRRAFRVSSDGELCPVAEEPTPIAYAHQAICID